MLVAFTALCAAAASPHSGLVSPRPALLRLSGGATAAAQPAVAVADPQPGKPHEQQKAARRHKWRGSVLVISLLYSVALVNGFVRRTLSCASPLQERSGWLPREQIEEISMLGYQSFAAGRALAAPFIVRLGAKRALLLQLTVLASACVAICVTPHASALRVQTVSWALVRVFSAMTVTLMLPFVRTWVPRDAYGRVWGLLQSGVQTGGLLAYHYYGRQLKTGTMVSWRAPFALGAALCVPMLIVCAWMLPAANAGPAKLSPAAAAAAAKAAETAEAEAAAAAANKTAIGTLPAASRKTSSKDAAVTPKPPPPLPPPPPPPPTRTPLGSLLRKFAAKPQFWLMLLAVGCYTPLYEYGTFVTHYLKQLRGDDIPVPQNRGWCIEQSACADRYGAYQTSYVLSLVVGSFIYDRCSQFDKALMVLLLMSCNVGCWVALVLSERPLPAAPEETPPPGLRAIIEAALSGQLPIRGGAAPRVNRPIRIGKWVLPELPELPLSPRAKTMVVAAAAAALAIPTSLPFAYFALDFGKEGAAILSSLLSTVGLAFSLASLRLLPQLQRAYGWYAVHAMFAGLGLMATLAMSTVMFADQRKFARGYIIRSSYVNETVVTLHACARACCAGYPMWRPGALRPWGRAVSPSGFKWLRSYAPTRYCHECGRTKLAEVQVGEAFVGLSLLAPYDESLARGLGNETGAWVRKVSPLRKPEGGWQFADPTRYPVADPVYGDRKSYERRLNASRAEANQTTTATGGGGGEGGGSEPGGGSRNRTDSKSKQQTKPIRKGKQHRCTVVTRSFTG